jgi:hypothetical protein
VIIWDDFLPNAEKVAAEFPAFKSDAWFEYNNPIEVKKTLQQLASLWARDL